MTHECPKCKSLFDCIYDRCKLPRLSLCFSCFAKPWHS